MSFRDTQQSPPQGGGFVFGWFLSLTCSSQQSNARELTLPRKRRYAQIEYRSGR